MMQARLNSCVICHVYGAQLDGTDTVKLAKEFVKRSDIRKKKKKQSKTKTSLATTLELQCKSVYHVYLIYTVPV